MKKIDDSIRRRARQAGSRLREARVHLGWSQQDLAIRCGEANPEYAKGNISAFEGHGKPAMISVAFLSRWADALGVSLDWLWGRSNERPALFKLPAAYARPTGGAGHRTYDARPSAKTKRFAKATKPPT